MLSNQVALSGLTLRGGQENERSRVPVFTMCVIPTEPPRHLETLDGPLDGPPWDPSGQGQNPLGDADPYPGPYEVAVALRELNEDTDYTPLRLPPHACPGLIPPPPLQALQGLQNFG